MKVLDANIRIGRVSSNQVEDYITIEIEDEKSGIQFIDINLSMAQFGHVISGSSRVKCKMTVRGADNIGKKYEHKRGSKIISREEYKRVTGDKYTPDKKDLQKWLEANAQEEGWHIDTYLGSQDSIRYVKDMDGDRILNFSYYRYVDDVQV